MPKWRVYLWEWDSDNGEYVYRDYYGETIEAKDLEELYTILEKRAESMAKEVEKEGWECEPTPGLEQTYLECTKCVEEEGEEYCMHRQIGYDIEEEKE